MQCGELREVLRPIALRADLMECNKCGDKAERIVSRFNSLDNSEPTKPAQFKEGGETNSKAANHGVAAIRGARKTIMEDCIISGLPVGLQVATGSEVKIRNTRFHNVARPVEVTEE